ncbi:MAG TPA: hypothetical protein VL381_08855 [Rhodocyclaceae bacterium]|jgi:hypothetical protein|nr:hypothetical protein [Rhodocyclaceae bacterium]
MSDPTQEPASPLLQQADALMRRHRRVFVAGADTTPAPNATDVPVLTEVFEADALIADASQVAEDEVRARIHAAVGANEAELARALERWIATQLPHALSLALDSVADQLKLELAARLRAELLTRPMFDQLPRPTKPSK